MAQTIETLKRRLETILGDFKRARATWQEIGEDAFSDANSLVNSVIQSRCDIFLYMVVFLAGLHNFDASQWHLYAFLVNKRYVDDPSYWHPGLCNEFPDIVQAYNAKMSWIIGQHLEKLWKIVQQMVRWTISFFLPLPTSFFRIKKKQQDKMKQQLSELGMICKRSRDLRGEEFVEHEPLYRTCPMRIFVTRFESIVHMYEDAQKVLDSLLGPEGFTNVKSREEGLALLSIWIHHPSIDDDAVREFEELCEIEVFS
ncbi:hypothetical protein BX666DRAFT_1980911 [Dichotomocladium elegans]|nr:hypothetical protein BX666DRAFT_1980911 [Dichotomocladium elegans]